jgi:hypothetical protein
MIKFRINDREMMETILRVNKYLKRFDGICIAASVTTLVPAMSNAPKKPAPRLLLRIDDDRFACGVRLDDNPAGDQDRSRRCSQSR